MNKLSYIIILVLSPLLFSSCTKTETISDFECEEIAMKDFKGLPSYGKVFKENCMERDLVYSRQKCQLAFNDLIYGKGLVEIKKTYGERIINCFNERELEKYAPPTKLK